jgi:hypothetical protein
MGTKMDLEKLLQDRLRDSNQDLVQRLLERKEIASDHHVPVGKRPDGYYIYEVEKGSRKR